VRFGVFVCKGQRTTNWVREKLLKLLFMNSSTDHSTVLQGSQVQTAPGTRCIFIACDSFRDSIRTNKTLCNPGFQGQACVLGGRIEVRWNRPKDGPNNRAAYAICDDVILASPNGAATRVVSEIAIFC